MFRVKGKAEYSLSVCYSENNLELPESKYPYKDIPYSLKKN